MARTLVRVWAAHDGYTLAECDTEAEALAFSQWLQRERAGLVAEFRAVQALEAHRAAEVARAPDRRSGVLAGEYLTALDGPPAGLQATPRA